MLLALTYCLIIVIAVATTLVHYDALRYLFGLARRRRTPRSTVLVVVSGLLTVHMVEIARYAGLYALGAGVLGLGTFGGDIARGFVTMLRFSAETYATLGYGDVIAKGNLRLIAGAETLNGLLLLAWSGSALFLLVQDLGQPPRAGSV